MKYWLVKSEPFKYSFDDLLRDKQTHWNGVRNFQARNNLKAMRRGDQALFYHSNEGKEVVGVAEIVREAYPDSTATEGDWVMVDLKATARFQVPVTLTDIKAMPELKGMGLLKQARLSVVVLTKAEFDKITKKGMTS
jgi:predicted RNA-binding protein with PUA-like domain